MGKDNFLSYKDIYPNVHESVFVANGAHIIGDVTIGENSNIWFNTVVRGDVQHIRIGKYTNIQDNSTVHVMYDHPTIIDDYVTAGHGVILHGCHVGSQCLIGMGAIILGYSEIGDNCIIAAGTLIPERKVIPPNSLVMGSPGKIVRTVTDEEIEAIRWSALKYHEVAQLYLASEG